MSVLRPAIVALVALLAAGSAHAQIAFRAWTSASVTGPSTIVYQGQGNAASRNNCGTINPAIPGGTTAGDLLIAVISSGAQPVLTMTGWNQLFFNVGATTHSAAIYWRIATGGDPNTINQQSSCNSLIARISRFSGVDTRQPFQTAPVAAGNWSYQNANSVMTGTQSVPYSGAMVVFTALSTDDDTFGAEPGFTQAYNSTTTTGNDTAIALYYSVPATAPTFTAGPYNVSKNRGGDPNHGVVFALRPAGSVLTINVPAGTIANDVLITSVAALTNSTIVAAPAGWTTLLDTPQSVSDPSRLVTFYRIATGAEPASYTFALDGGANGGAAGGMLAFSGVETGGAGPINAQGSNVTASSLVHAANAITTTTANTMLVGAFEFASSPTSANWNPTGGQGMVEAVDARSIAAQNNGGVALLMSYGAQGVAGSSGTKSATASGVTADVGAGHLIALRPVSPTLQWTMDEGTWNGSTNEVQDSSGNGLNGTSYNGAVTAGITPAIPGNPGTCRYGNFDGVDDYVLRPDNALLGITDELTVMAWIRPTVLPTGGNLKTIVSKDDNYEFHLDNLGRIYWWWGGGPLELRSTGTVALNAWTHVAIVYSRSGAFQRIYLNGVQDASTNNQSGALPINALPFQVAGDQGIPSRRFEGKIDEVNVYRTALTGAGITAIMNRTRPCVAAINHFSISHAGSGIACVDQTITITAHDASHNPADANSLLVNLSTTNAKGSWIGVLAGGGTLTDATPGDGAATYQFAPGSNSVQLSFRYANLAATSETLAFNVSGGGFSESTGTANGSDDPSFTISQAGFQFRNVTDGTTTIPTQISGKPSNAGFNAKTVRVQAIRTDTVTGSCTGMFAGQTRTIELGAECNNPSICAGQQASVNGVNIATSNNNGGAGAAAYSGVSLAFNASSEADTVVAYPNAGQISLHARYDLDSGVAGFEMVGSSNAFVVRPFGLRIAGPPSGRAGPASTVYAKAGQTWPDAVTVTAVVWEAGEDANNDGVPDSDAVLSGNAVTTNFGLESAPATVTITHMLAEPAGGNSGTLSAPLSAFSGGTGSASASWSEMGLINLFANSGNYLGSGQSVSNSAGGYAGVGRFIPYDFAVTRNAPFFTPACSNNFTYVGQPFNYLSVPVLTVTARNRSGITTQNYAGTFMKISNASITPNSTPQRYSRFDALGGGSTPALDVSSLPSASADPAIGAFTAGVGNLTFSGGAVGAVFTRSLQVAPFDADIALSFSLADTDGIVVASIDGAAGANPVSFGAATAGNGIGFAGGATAKQVRFGRLTLGNAFGSELLDLPIPIQTQYYTSGGVYVTNVADNCTAIALNDIFLSSGTPAGGGTFVSGKGNLKITKPLSEVSIDLCVDLDGSSPTDNSCIASVPANRNYLQWKWSGSTFDRDPKARATFGAFKNADEFIYPRENF